MKLRKKMFISYAILDIYNEYVAPRAGAWIETLSGPTHCLILRVAPRAGAWIETQAYKFTRTSGAGNGGGYLESGYMECSPIGVCVVGFSIKSSVAGLKNIVKIRYFDKDKVYISDQDV